MAKLKTETIDGRRVEIIVEDDGRFVASCDGDEWRDVTYSGVLDKVRRDLRKSRVRIAIPATMVGSELHKPKYGRPHARAATAGVRHFTITGMHGRTRNVLVKWEDTGESEQLRYYGSGNIVRRLTAADVSEFVTLAKERDRANKAYDAFIEKRALGSRRDISEYVEEAIRQKEDEPTEDGTNDASEGDPRLAAPDHRSRKRRRS